MDNISTKVLGIEIGGLETKICEMVKLGSKIIIKKSIIFQTPPDTVEDGYIRDKGVFCTALKSVLKQEKIKGNKVIFSIASTKIYTKEIIIPRVSKSKIMSIVQTNLSDYLPFSTKDYIVNYSILQRINEKKEKKLRLMLIAVPDNLVKNYYSMAEAADLTIESLDYNGNSVYQLLKGVKSKGTSLYIQMKEQSTMVSIIKDRNLTLQRTITYGTNEILQAVMEHNVGSIPSEQQAYELLTKSDFINYETSEAELVQMEFAATQEPGIQMEDTMEAVSDTVAYLVSSLGRVIDYYINQSGDIIENIYLLGYGSRIKGMKEYIQKELGVYPMTLSQLNGCIGNRSAESYNQNPSKYMNAVGALLHPVGFIPKKLAERKQKKSIAIETGVIVASCMLGIVGLYYDAKSTYQEARDSYEAKNEELNKLKISEDKNEGYNQLTDQLNQLVNLDQMTQNHLAEVYDIMGAMEQCMVKQTKVTQVQMDATGITMTIFAPTKRTAAKMIQQLGTLTDYFESFQISNVSETAGEDEAPIISFNVNCLFEKTEIAVPETTTSEAGSESGGEE